MNKRKKNEDFIKKTKLALENINNHFSKLNLKAEILIFYKDFYNLEMRKIVKIIQRLLGVKNDLLSSFSSVNSTITNKAHEKIAHRATIQNKQKKPSEIEKKKKGGCLIF